MTTVLPTPSTSADRDPRAPGRGAAEPPVRPVRRSLALGVPFVALNLSVVAVVFVGWSAVAVAVCVAMYVVRMFGITAFYHRYFSHRAFRVSRPVQLAGAVLGASAAQRGPLWWAAHHRRHHRSADRPGDPHSPVQSGFLSAHVLWMFTPANRRTDLALVEDLAAFPELRFLDRFHHLVPIATAAGSFVGASLGALLPGLHTSGPQLLVWGFCVSTVRRLPGDVRDQFGRPPRRLPPVRDERRQPQQLVPRPGDHGRRVAQQPPPVPRSRPAGLQPLGAGPHVRRSVAARPAPGRARPAPGPGQASGDRSPRGLGVTTTL